MDSLLKLFIVAGLPAFALFFYNNLYCSYRLLKTIIIFDWKRPLPSYTYLLGRYAVEALRKKQGQLYSVAVKDELAFTIFNCRLDINDLRRYCIAVGYGWDYPDSVFRDIPLCYPDFLCSRLLAMIVSSERFKLSPLGLVRVRQTVRTFQPVDELKKGPFLLQAMVTEYRTVEAGVEVDISLKANRADQPVWESVLTMLSQKTDQMPSEQPVSGGHDEPDNVKSVEIRIPWFTWLRCAWAFCDYSPQHLFILPAKMLGYKCPTAHGLWMLSKCLAEIEKHKGVDAVRAPVSVCAHVKQPLFIPGKATIRFWKTAAETSLSSHKGYSFQMEDTRTRTPHIFGEICRTKISSQVI